MVKKLFIIENSEVDLLDDGSVRWVSKMAVDADGSGPSHGDKFFQPSTSLKLNGKPLNADIDPYIVVPPQVVYGVKGVVKGCQGYVTFRNKTVPAVVGDEGAADRLGEGSIALARELGIPDSPVNGGESAHDVTFVIHPGVPAIVNGKHYTLQPS